MRQRRGLLGELGVQLLEVLLCRVAAFDGTGGDHLLLAFVGSHGCSFRRLDRREGEAVPRHAAPLHDRAAKFLEKLDVRLVERDDAAHRRMRAVLLEDVQARLVRGASERLAVLAARRPSARLAGGASGGRGGGCGSGRAGSRAVAALLDRLAQRAHRRHRAHLGSALAREQVGRRRVGELGARLGEERQRPGRDLAVAGDAERFGERRGGAVGAADAVLRERDVAHLGDEGAAPFVMDMLAGGEVGAQFGVVAFERRPDRLRHHAVPARQGALLELLERDAVARAQDVPEDVRQAVDRRLHVGVGRAVGHGPSLR